MFVKSNRNASDAPSKQTNRKRTRVNWHEAASCALQIELRDYSDILEYMEEYILGKNSYRIDLLVIKKLTEQTIPKNIALIFKTFNLFEIKGVGSTAGIDSYYKTIGYAGLLIDQTGAKDQYSSLDVSLTILSCHYPVKLIKHLRDERKLSVEKISPGVYHINKETFNTQIIVTNRLTPEDNLYLRCLTDKLHNMELADKLADDYQKHWEQEIYDRYMRQLAVANKKSEGGAYMVINEWLYEMCGTSSDEVIARAKKESEAYYQPKIDYLKSLLIQNNIPFDLETEYDAD
ncbi:MAG: hypothetical protein J1F18_07215 [Lachnospiraceae bacterium]|nr:hypothetical protein [Lachnospiraceae bacterium]